MNDDAQRARAVADAVLYEGFLLFPYRGSALKNQQRWQFGVLMPRGYDDASEPTSFSTQMPVIVDAEGAEVEAVVRFLQETDDTAEREITVALPLDRRRCVESFEIGDLRGTVTLSADGRGAARRLTLVVRNETLAPPDGGRTAALRAALISAHALLSARGSHFASLLDPPADAREAAESCENDRVFPVLIGAAGQSGQTAAMMLASPIILQDFPSIADASAGHTFDGTEIDELLMLSVASLSDGEKKAARSTHAYARQLLERAEALDADTISALHGELTGSGKAGDESISISGTTVRCGSLVRVHPKGRADVWDQFVDGLTARVCAVHTDFEGQRYVGVLFDADPATDMHQWYGRSFFYSADEIEPLTEAQA